MSLPSAAGERMSVVPNEIAFKNVLMASPGDDDYEKYYEKDLENDESYDEEDLGEFKFELH